MVPEERMTLCGNAALFAPFGDPDCGAVKRVASLRFITSPIEREGGVVEKCCKPLAIDFFITVILQAAPPEDIAAEKELMAKHFNLNPGSREWPAGGVGNPDSQFPHAMLTNPGFCPPKIRIRLCKGGSR
jgi:hypothetical protein